MAVKVNLETLLALSGLPKPTPEYRFAPPRMFRFDYCWKPEKLAVEIEGGIWIGGGGRHNRGAGFSRDIEKYNCAVLLGWRLLRFTPKMVETGEAVELIRRAMGLSGVNG